MKKQLLTFALVAFAACSNDNPSRVKATSATAPALLESGPTNRTAKSEPVTASVPGRAFESAQRWDLSDPDAVKTLRGTAFGEKEISEFWTKKGWRLTKEEEEYMERVEKLLAAGKIKKVTHWAQTPYNAVYQAQETLTLEGMNIPNGYEFWFELCENEDELHVGKPLFPRSADYVQENAGRSTSK